MSTRDFQPDPHNANRGTERGEGVVERSLQSFGAGRSILATSDGVILAGNKTFQKAQELGIPIQEVESDGHTLFVIRRTDLPYDDPRARELALADNRASETGLSWSPEVLTALAEDGVDLDQFWFEDELSRLLGRPDDDEWSDAFAALPDGGKSPFQQMTFTVSDGQAEQVGAALKAAKALGPFVDTGNENSNGNALARICETYLTEHGR